MTQITGVVSSMNSKDGQGARGPWTKTSIQVNGVWYGSFKPVPCQQGDTISFTGEQRGQFWNIVDGSVTKTEGAAPAAGGGGYTPPVNTRDVSIQLQSSRKDALTLLPVLLEQGAISFPAKVKQADKYDFLCSVVDELTAQNYLKLQAWIEAGGISDADFIPSPEG